jgi:hypothetical protein
MIAGRIPLRHDTSRPLAAAKDRRINNCRISTRVYSLPLRPLRDTPGLAGGGSGQEKHFLGVRPDFPLCGRVRQRNWTAVQTAVQERIGAPGQIAPGASFSS